MKMKRLLILAVLSFALFAAGCNVPVVPVI